MTQTLAITNQKGGVGKTTTCVNLAASLVRLGRRVLVIDLDPQGNATTGSGHDKHGQGPTSCELLLGEERLAGCVRRVDSGFDLVPANGDLTLAEVRLMTMERREFRLREMLQSASSDYHHVLIDCPPSLNLLTVNALVAADGVLIPMQCEYYALEGLTALMGTIESIQRGPNPRLRIAGLLRTMFDPRNRLSGEVSDQLLGHFGERVFRTIVPRNVRLAEAPSFGQPALLYDASSRGAVAYLALAGEMLRRPASGGPSPAGI
ncbi:ParA family protein [Thioalkalivibrio paradoxus]|uniref:Chromosome partitioning protein ParA n=1 Tax=Thioalkalivibrio paradoxus ARh 1 TaxID=713585 RepID=W0DMP1_9GAMM|nr:ParA family protein [Thioalkalivibrio paradoxus]AHE99701.1 chromosome partitioning protein ParA [Thioalkalivibrio paradoxus ARh 1]